ncbi:hypothetical protein ARMSODRAFT_289183 [Armillaria solidipes]|uniref:Uncharacterized protein n=1 Tax=Armillaria solidipes TaxID=1076256 RepID=A0A2H3CGP9_9AGAR|nr:hypothetical protein ARMSODRAFT_289183 [Armillaria solidipes]
MWGFVSILVWTGPGRVATFQWASGTLSCTITEANTMSDVDIGCKRPLDPLITYPVFNLRTKAVLILRLGTGTGNLSDLLSLLLWTYIGTRTGELRCIASSL